MIITVISILIYLYQRLCSMTPMQQEQTRKIKGIS